MLHEVCVWLYGFLKGNLSKSSHCLKPCNSFHKPHDSLRRYQRDVPETFICLVYNAVLFRVGLIVIQKEERYLKQIINLLAL